MSRFWAAGGSSDDSDSASDDSDSSDESVVDNNNRKDGSRWVDFSDDSDSEDDVRVVKSAKERSLEAFTSHIKNIRAFMKQRDFKKIQSEFDELSKAMIKAKKVLAAGVPRQLVRTLVELEDFVKECLEDKVAFKKLTPNQGRALNRMKLTLKKHNKPFQVVMDHYRKNPIIDEDDGDSDDDEDDDDDDDSDSSSSDSDAAPAKPAAKKKPSSDSSSSSDSSDSDSDSDDDADSDDDDKVDEDDDDEWASDSDSDEESDDEEQGAYAELKGRARWLKKNTVTTKKVVKNKDERAKSRAEAKKAAEAAAQASESSMASKSVLPAENLTPSVINKKVKELIASRGRRGTDMRQVLRQLEALAKLSLEFGPRVEIPILMNVITAQFDLQRSMDDYMPTKTWKACANYLSRITDTLDEGYTLGKASIEEVELIGIGGGQKMKAVAASTDGAMAAIAADDKLVNPITGEAETEDERAERIRLEKEENMTEEEKKTIHVLGSYSLFLSTLEQEYVKSVQQISPHTKEFIARLRDESILVELLTKGQAYYERENALEDAALLAQLRFEHIYYRHDSIGQAVDKANMFYRKYGEADMLHPACLSDEAGAVKSPNFAHTHPAAVGARPNVPESTIASNSADLISDIATFVYQHGTDRSKTRAMICHIYHHALHDRFTEARDLLLMSHLQDTIANAGDVSTMIMFNRMMVTLGMAAFRLGKIWSAHQALADTCSGRVRELLAQGVSTGRFNDKTPDEEKAEKRRQVPYHMHINLDLLEACHLISAMLLEVPNMAAAEERRARVISRTFRKHHDMYQRQVFTGPPEQTRDFVMRASKALRTGDWKTCAHFLTDMDVWKLVPGEGSAVQIQKMLFEKIKLEGLRTYLFAFSNQYESLSLTQLCGMFEMSKNEVHSVVSKMIINRDLYASWDQPTETIVMRKVEPTSLQLMALQFSEKAVTLVESNERLLDAASGSYGYKEGGDYHHQDGRQNNQSGGGGRGGFRTNTGGGGRGRSSGRGSGGRGDSGRGDGGRGRGRGGGGRGRGGNANNRDGGRGGGGAGGRSRY